MLSNLSVPSSCLSAGTSPTGTQEISRSCHTFTGCLPPSTLKSHRPEARLTPADDEVRLLLWFWSGGYISSNVFCSFFTSSCSTEPLRNLPSRTSKGKTGDPLSIAKSSRPKLWESTDLVVVGGRVLGGDKEVSLSQFW